MLDKATVAAVARELGVAPNALYSHVRDKDDLLDAVLAHYAAWKDRA